MAMHYESRRQGMPGLSLNCAGYPDTIEAELFGHVRGGASDADRDRPGLFEEADGGVLFLEEIGELDPAMQVRVLKTIESGEVRYAGESLLDGDGERLRSLRGSELSIIFQDAQSALTPTLRVGEQVAEVFAAHGDLSKE